MNQETGTGRTLVWQNHWGGIKLVQHGEETEALKWKRRVPDLYQQEKPCSEMHRALPQWERFAETLKIASKVLSLPNFLKGDSRIYSCFLVFFLDSEIFRFHLILRIHL